MNQRKAINAVIRIRMAQLDINQRKLAQKAGMSAQALNHDLHDGRKWQVNTLNKIARGLGWTDAADILLAAREEEKKSPQVLTVGSETRKE